MPKNALFALLSLIVVALAPTSSHAQTAEIKLDQLMTDTQFRSFGLTKLTAAEKARFERWLSETLLEAYQLGLNQQSPSSGISSYGGVGGGHWIKSKAERGAIIILEDGSMWGISAIDRWMTSIWLPITNITVVISRSPIGDYRYTLINTDDGEQAAARFIGMQ